MCDRAKFFAGIRSLGRLSQAQVDGFNAVLDAAPADLPQRHLAYCLATAWHETAFTMKPIEEYGRGKGKPYGPTGYWGRGYVQLTWDYNYKKAGLALGVDLLGNPALAMRPDLAAKIMFDGMTAGWFTGHKLADYFNATTVDPVNARRIINGLDKAAQIAGYYTVFSNALVPAVPIAANDPVPIPIQPDPPKPAPAPLPASPAPVPAAPVAQQPQAKQGFWARFFAALFSALSKRN